MHVNSDEQDEHVYQEFIPGWAKRPPHGHCYGKKYISSFMDDILQMIQDGETDKSHKMGPGRMREMLIAKYPDRLDMPSESELQQDISKIIVQVKKEKHRH